MAAILAAASLVAPPPTAGQSPAGSGAPSARAAAPTYSARAAKARKQRLARAQAAARAREQAAASIPRFKLDDHGSLVPDVRAEAAIIYNPSSGEVIWEAGGFSPHSIASITKVMTAVCFLDAGLDLTREVQVARPDVVGASTTYLRAFERVRLEDVLYLALVASDNVAARTLARAADGSPGAFVARMNATAADLGLTATVFADPSGLDANNVSSAYDIARLIAYASEDELLASIMRTSEYTFRTNRRTLTIRNTNQLLRTADLDVRAGKTGFISKAGHCLATLLRVPELNQSVAVVVLGARSNAGRFWETRHLFNWLASQARSLIGEGGPGGHQPPAPQAE